MENAWPGIKSSIWIRCGRAARLLSGPMRAGGFPALLLSWGLPHLHHGTGCPGMGGCIVLCYLWARERTGKLEERRESSETPFPAAAAVGEAVARWEPGASNEPLTGY